MKSTSQILAFFPAFADTLRRAAGWQRAGWAFLFGSVMSFSMPPYDLFPLLWVGLPALIFLVQGTVNDRQAFATGWSFAFGFLTLSLYWIAAAMLVDLHHFWWAIPLSVFGLPALFAIYYGIAATIARRMGITGIQGAINFALLWFAADYARGHMFTGFPWNLIGYTWSGVLPVLQITSLIGIYGLTLLTILAAALPASLYDQTLNIDLRISQLGPASRPSGSRLRRGFGGHVCGMTAVKLYKSHFAIVVSLILFIGIAVWGEVRLQTTQVRIVPDVRLRIVQPNVAQESKWLLSERERDFKKLLDLTSAPPIPAMGDQPPTHVIWPETASTFYLSEDTIHRQMVAAHIPASADVITGVIRRDVDEEGTTRFYNSLVAVDGLGRLVAGYDKAHLVPFGEYMPYRKYTLLRTLAAGGADFTAGPGPRSLRILGLPLFSPLICYEAIFPHAVTDPKDRPDFMINITNDGWYGNTIGPYQHFAIVRVRTIEEGLPLIRAANTGISGIIDPVGRITARIGLGKQGFIDGSLPTPLLLTFYAKWGDIPVLVVFSLMFIFALGAFVRRRTMTKSQ